MLRVIVGVKNLCISISECGFFSIEANIGFTGYVPCRIVPIINPGNPPIGEDGITLSIKVPGC